MAHIYANVIKAWADGEKVEMRCTSNPESQWEIVDQPKWELAHVFAFRVKKDYKPFHSIARCIKFDYDTAGLNYHVLSKPNVRFTFDTQTCELVDVELIHED